MSKHSSNKRNSNSKVREIKLEALVVLWQVKQDLLLCLQVLKECRGLTKLPHKPRQTKPRHKPSPNHPSLRHQQGQQI